MVVSVTDAGDCCDRYTCGVITGTCDFVNADEMRCGGVVVSQIRVVLLQAGTCGVITDTCDFINGYV